MNWLAHLLLSDRNIESRLGNLLADLVKGVARQSLNDGIHRGIQCHQTIDIFTDNHDIVRHSKQRLNREYRKFSGILIDVFYDHFLAKNWSCFSPQPLEVFTAEIYQSFQCYGGELPSAARDIIERMVTEDWLGSYKQIMGVENALMRISKRLSARWQRDFYLHHGIDELKVHYQDLEADFLDFFPQLSMHVHNWYLN
jgi:acyl carrier protein phosphodiesterase